MDVLSELGMTGEDLRRAIRGHDGATGRSPFLVAAASEAVLGPRRPPAAWGGDPRVEAVLGESAVRTALGVRETVERVIEQAAAAGAPWATSSFAERLREHVAERLYEAATLDAREAGPGAPCPESPLMEFLRESGDDVDAMRARVREEV